MIEHRIETKVDINAPAARVWAILESVYQVHIGEYGVGCSPFRSNYPTRQNRDAIQAAGHFSST
jgi:hypothetical protein